MVFALPTLTLSNLDPISSRRPINIHHAPITPTQLIESHSGSSRRRLIHPWVVLQERYGAGSYNHIEG